MKKTIIQADLSEELIKTYSKGLRSIKEHDSRLVLAVYPFMGLLASLLADEGISLKTVLNIIVYESIHIRYVTNLLKVTNREILSPESTEVTSKELGKCYQSCKDEVLILDFRENESYTPYSCRKKANYMRRLVNTFAGTSALEVELAPFGVATISNAFCVGENVCNIFLGKTDFAESSPKFVAAMTAIIYAFIEFVEKNYVDVQDLIRTNKKGNSSGNVFEIVFSILRFFWKAKGYEINELVGCNLEEINFYKILFTKSFDEENLLNEFVTGMRSIASEIRFVSKGKPILDSKVVLFDDEWLWIKKDVFETYCYTMGLGGYVARILVQLKERDLLKHDCDGSFSRRIQIAGIRGEFYQIDRTLFDIAGIVSIVELGKE
jgi:hypothetical protein